uniref:C-type lectin domain-containing protein n=1 Tax=Panagrolaimus sp. PS1159 TaxID=55785 RepID=A0AC35F9D2_9BILA
MNWLDAEKYCNSYGSHLASIHSNEKAMFIADLAYYDGSEECTYGKQAFVGLHTEDNNAHWQWTDGKFLNWENWDIGEPNNPEMENCVELRLANTCGRTKGTMNNYGCDRLDAKFICKKTLE